MQVADVACLPLDESTNRQGDLAPSIAAQKHVVEPIAVYQAPVPRPPPLQVQRVAKELALERTPPSTTTDVTRRRASRARAVEEWKAWMNDGDTIATSAPCAPCAPCAPPATAGAPPVDASINVEKATGETPPVPENPYGWRTIEELEEIESRKTKRRRERLIEDRIELLSATALYSQLRSPQDAVRRNQAVRALRCLTRREQILSRDDAGLMCRTPGCTAKVVRPGFDVMTVATAEQLSTWYEISNASVHRCTRCWHNKLS